MTPCEQDPASYPLPRISVIIPCRNEVRFIGKCIASALANDYPRDRLEILVVDGASSDGTVDIIRAFAHEYPCVRAIVNSKRITPAALNLGILLSTGEIVFRIDAHALLATDYLRLCVEGLRKHHADNVGGAMETLPGGEGIAALAIAAVMSHPFGVGNSDFRTSVNKVTATDTVFGGCYRREIFQKIGFFNERLLRTQDLEFNRRLLKAGGRIALDPRIRCSYFASPGLSSFIRHNFQDGVWSVLPFAYSAVVPVRLRHLTPAVFVALFCILAILAVNLASFRPWLVALAGLYSAASLASSAHIAFRKRALRFLLVTSLAFAIRHFAYGFGSLGAFMKLAFNCLTGRRPQRTESPELQHFLGRILSHDKISSLRNNLGGSDNEAHV